MKKVAFSSKPLDDSNGLVKNGQNKAMQFASQTTELPATAKKRLRLLAALAIGVDAAASFLKTKMEKAAAVASQVGAAVLQSKKAISSAAAAVLGDIQPKPPKIAENHLAKGKARLASIPILALLAGIFIAQPQAMAFILPETGPMPQYDEQIELNTQGTQTLPIIGLITDSRENWWITYRFNSEVFSPGWREEWGYKRACV